MGRAVIIIDGNYTRKTATDWVSKAPTGTVIEFRRSKRTVDQNSRMWAMLTDVARQLKWHGERLEPEDWKLLFLDALGRENRVVPGINGGIVSLGTSSSKLTKDEMSDLMEVMSAFGANNGVTFREPALS
jgi:hypothetical protein